MHDRFLAFVARKKHESAQAIPGQIRSRLGRVKSGLQAHQADLRNWRQERATAVNTAVHLQETIENEPTDETIIDEFLRLTTVDYVIGTRVAMTGQLYIQIRVDVEHDGILYDVGDFEVGLVEIPNRAPMLYAVNAIRVANTIDIGWDGLDGFHDVRRLQLDCWEGSVLLRDDFVRQCRLVDFVEAVHEILVQSATRHRARRGLPEVVPTLQSIWDGFLSNPLKAYKRSVALLCSPAPRDMLVKTERLIDDLDERIPSCVASIRESHASIRRLNAELVKATEVAAASAAEIDEVAVRAELDTIVSLPGVMGIRFSPAGVPVIHIRTSHVYLGHRYDMGDYEVSLTYEGRNTARGVVKVRSTRMSRDSFYRHHGGNESEWFCFGQRQTELERLFDAFEFAQFVHLVINSMNGVNEEHKSERQLSSTFTEIPLDAVWSATPPPPPEESSPLEPTKDRGRRFFGLLTVR